MGNLEDILMSRKGGRAGKEEFDYQSMAELMDQTYNLKALKRGDIVEGTVVHVSPHEILVDIGAKSEGVVSLRELEQMEPDELRKIKVGDQVLACVLNPESQEGGGPVLSLKRAELEKDWRLSEKCFQEGRIVECTVSAYNRGGLIVHLGKVRGFVPASQLSGYKHSPERKAETEEFLASLVGQKLQLKIIELDRSRNRLIFSERAAAQEWSKIQKEKLLNELKEGQTRIGRVSSLCDFGAFVDLGGADGLIHLSELSWTRVNHPREVLQVGDEVEVYILSVDRERQRIGLSLKKLQPEPWSLVNEKYSIGQLVEGTITKLADFGAFALVDGEIEGLIHISELSNETIRHPREVVKEGDTITLRIIGIDPERRRMGLSLRQVDEDTYAELSWNSFTDE